MGLTEEYTTSTGKTKTRKAKGKMKQYIIITFSRKAMEYQRHIRNNQIERAERLIKNNKVEDLKKNKNRSKKIHKKRGKTETKNITSIKK